MSRASWFVPKRLTEATQQQIVATGAAGGGYVGPNDPDYEALRGFRQLGGSYGSREMPAATLEAARTSSVAAYRSNPMAKAIIDTYVSFVVGDSGLSLTATDADVQAVADSFWRDPRVALNQASQQEVMLRSHLLMGESAYEALVGERTGVVRYAPIDTTQVYAVTLERGVHGRWADLVLDATDPGGERMRLAVIRPDEQTGLLDGDVLWWPFDRALETDRRGQPFLTPLHDWLDAYDKTLSNLVDRTTIARHIAFDVTVDGDQADVDAFIASRGGTHAPMSGTAEVHNRSVEWKPMQAQSGAYEDRTTATSILTTIAGGAGLSKTWLADPEGANRASGATMAEPIRRRVGGVQNVWLANVTQMVRFAVDRAVAAGALPATVTMPDGEVVTTSQTVTVTGPQIAGSDAQVNARVLLQLSQALDGLVSSGLMTPEAATVAATTGWENFVGVPYTPDLGTPDAAEGDIATAIDDAETGVPA